MKKLFVLTISFLLAANSSRAQDIPPSGNNYRNFPIIIGLQFQNLAFPLHDLTGNFRNIGFTIGTEVSLNGKHNWAQRLEAGYYFNKNAGDGMMISTQTIYRPAVFDHFYPELKAGIGWQRVFHPVETYEFNNGKWAQTGDGKSQLIVPLGISVGYNPYSENTYVSPYISYEVIPALFYNRGIPLNFYSLFQVGTRIHLK